MFINFTELYASGGTFDRQEVIKSSNDTTVIYGGYAPIADPNDPNVNDRVWLIRKLVITESVGVKTVECTWARAPWNRRSNIETKYQYGKP